mgnify:CR=1 FL=1
MRRNRLSTMVVLVGCVGLVVAVEPTPSPEPPPEKKPDEKPAEIGWEVRASDGKYYKVTPVDAELTVETKYGTMKVPMKEVKRVEFGLRVSAAQKKAITDAMSDVMGGNGRTREAGKEAILDNFELLPQRVGLARRQEVDLQPQPEIIPIAPQPAGDRGQAHEMPRARSVDRVVDDAQRAPHATLLQEMSCVSPCASPWRRAARCGARLARAAAAAAFIQSSSPRLPS